MGGIFVDPSALWGRYSKQQSKVMYKDMTVRKRSPTIQFPPILILYDDLFFLQERM